MTNWNLDASVLRDIIETYESAVKRSIMGSLELSSEDAGKVFGCLVGTKERLLKEVEENL